jgi:ribonuclease P protein component
MDYSFSKSYILSKQIDIDELFSKGKRIRNQAFTMLYQKVPLTVSPFQVLISVPKRKIKKAVDRNYLKRCMREVVRKNKELLICQENVAEKSVHFAIIYNVDSKLDYSNIEKHLLDLFKKIPNLK